MIIFPYIISLAMGYLALNLCLRPSPLRNSLLHWALSLMMGLGLSALLTFYCFLCVGQFNRSAIILVNMMALIVLLAANLKWPALKQNKRPVSGFDHWDKISFGMWAVIFVVILFNAQKQHPFGEWDAWALWNMKLKFLVLGGTDWRDIFHGLHWHTQPEYPLLLPFINTWVHAFSNTDLIFTAYVTSSVFTLTGIMLLYTCLGLFIDKLIAFLSSLLLAVSPYFMFLATAQYADTPFASIMLSCTALMLLLVKTKNAGIALTFGLFLGLSTFTKNEGIVTSFLLFTLASIVLLRDKDNRSVGIKLIGIILGGLLATGLATIILKVGLAPVNKDIFVNPLSGPLNFFNASGLYILAKAILREIFHERWVHLWIFIVFMGFTAIPQSLNKEKKLLTIFMLLYFAILAYIYLTTINFNLEWRLKSTLHRIFFYQLPTILFICFYIHWHAKDQFPTHEHTQ